MEPPHGTKEQRDELLQSPDLPCHSASGKCTPLTSHLSCSNVGISGNCAKCYAARNLPDRVVEYNGEEDDDDIILVKLKNGCENNKLSDDSAMSLHNELENMCLSSTSTSLSALQPLVDAVSDQFNDHKINKNDPLGRNYTRKNETNDSFRTQSKNNQNFKRFEKVLPSASTENSGAKTDGKLGDAEVDTAFLSKGVPDMPEEIGAVALLPSLAPDSQADSITTSFFKLTNDYGPFPVCSPNPSACSKLIHDNANYVTTGFDCQTELTKCQQPLYNPFVLPFNSDRSSASGQWQQPPFLKSQSLDQFLEFALKSNLHHNDLFQTSELNKSQSTERETQETSIGNLSTVEVDLSKKKCCVPAYSSGNLDNTSSVVARSVEFLPASTPVQRTSIALKLQSVESRPIYPNVPYSPYASPYGSPRSNRRRPLRESRRISIEQTGSFLQLNQYKLMDQIGQGSYGLVKLAYSEEDSTHYAMKILSKRRLLRQAGLMRRGPKKSTSPLDRVYREIAVLKKLDHPNVVKLIEVLDDPIEDSLYLVFELVKLGEVLRIPTVKPLSEQRACSIFRDTLLGLEYLHYQRIIHADLKPGNLLLTECGHVKIADLGVCNEFFGEDATITNASTAGTPAFRAPETLKLEKHSYCGKAADIWALGATLYSLVYGNVPFVANSIPVLYEKIKSDPLAFPDTIQISDELRDCIKQMLTKDPSERIILPELKVHTWVTAGGAHSLPTEDENCRLVQVSDEDINSVVRSIPKLDTLILIKTMLKKHSFGNPFLKGVCGRASQSGVSRLERFVRAGRSNSAPGAYNSADRRFSGDNVLPSLSELSTSSNQEES